MAFSKVLIVEDELKLLDHLSKLLTDGGFQCQTCSSYTELRQITENPEAFYNLVLLDRLLQGRDSADLIPLLKNLFPEVKIIVVSAVNTAAEKALLLDQGADDYVAKPFDGEELTARIRALLRRNRSELKYGNLVLDSDSRTAKIGDHEIPLQNKEFLLLRTLLRTPGKVINKNYLYENVWEMTSDVESNVIEATMSKLRRRLEESGASFSIKSMRNKGYWVEE